MIEPQRQLAYYCQWLPDGSRQPCYAPAAFVLVRPSGETLTFSCEAHREAWAAQIRGKYEVLERTEWERQGRGYRGPHLGG
jgi:hypothetical protein